VISKDQEDVPMKRMLCGLWSNDAGQDVAEYALMLAVLLVVVAGSVAAIGTNADTIFGKARDALK
jgi:Flp pilus assembly pilin Flp